MFRETVHGFVHGIKKPTTSVGFPRSKWCGPSWWTTTPKYLFPWNYWFHWIIIPVYTCL